MSGSVPEQLPSLGPVSHRPRSAAAASPRGSLEQTGWEVSSQGLAMTQTLQPSPCPQGRPQIPVPQLMAGQQLPTNISWTRSQSCSRTSRGEGDHEPLTCCHQLGLIFLIPHLLLLHITAGEEETHHSVEELVGELDGERYHIHLWERDMSEPGTHCLCPTETLAPPGPALAPQNAP